MVCKRVIVLVALTAIAAPAGAALPPGSIQLAQVIEDTERWRERRVPGRPTEATPPRQPALDSARVRPVPPHIDAAEALLPVPDRWRVLGGLLGREERWYDPYNTNTLKGDRPLHGDWFLSLQAVSDTVIEPRSVPTFAGAQSTNDPGDLDVLGDPDQLFVSQSFLLGAVYYKGSTVFKPPTVEYRLGLALNYNRLEVDERRVLNIDPRVQQFSREDKHLGVQELLVDYHLRDVSANYDFDSIRLGIQPFTTDYRGFLFQDNALGLRLFGTRHSNRWQYNLGWFRRLEKDANSGFNDLAAGLRDDDVIVANLYRQDWPQPGFTSQLTLAHNRNQEDQPRFDANGFQARPAPLGHQRPRHYEVTYLGYNGDGHLGRLNLTASAYYARGESRPGSFTQADSTIDAGFAAAEASVDFSWLRLRLSALYASGDPDPFDDRSNGYDAIVENPIFAGADTSYWARQAVPLIGGGGVVLSARNGFLPSLRTSRELGQSNFDNPGLRLVGLGADLDLAPTMRLSANLNQLWFDETASLEVARNQAGIPRSVGLDGSLALTWRPWMSQNAVLRLSAAGLLPGRGFEALYGAEKHYSVLGNLILAF